jgi:hypothetical protein
MRVQQFRRQELRFYHNFAGYAVEIVTAIGKLV